MIRRSNIPALLVIISTFLFSCKDEEPILSGCCDNPAINTTVGNSHVYVPNFFTPNGDGINDQLFVSGDSLYLIAHMEIRNKDNEIVFMATNLLPHHYHEGWDGRVNGNVEEGLYDITIQVESTDGTIEILQGKVCNHLCNESGANMSALIGCQFPSQSNDGRFDPTLPSNEPYDCFEW